MLLRGSLRGFIIPNRPPSPTSAAAVVKPYATTVGVVGCHATRASGFMHGMAFRS